MQEKAMVADSSTSQLSSRDHRSSCKLPGKKHVLSFFAGTVRILSGIFRLVQQLQARPSDMCERAQPMAPAVKSVPKSFLWHAAVETQS
jgi:hypothetical protein